MRFRTALIVVVGSLVLNGCASSSTNSSAECPAPGVPGEVTVLAASSMKNVLTDIRDEYLKNHPCVTELNISFGSSGELATQIVNGAPADVFLAANESTKDLVMKTDAGDRRSELIARNKMAILVHKNSPYVSSIQKLTDLQDVVNPDISVGVCVASAPCGAILPALLEGDELTVSDIADTTAGSVQDLVTKVEMGELDAGIVFGSDCAHARKMQTAICVDINQDVPNPISSPLYVVALNSRSNTNDFVDYLASATTQTLLQKSYGFLAP